VKIGRTKKGDSYGGGVRGRGDVLVGWRGKPHSPCGFGEYGSYRWTAGAKKTGGGIKKK